MYLVILAMVPLVMAIYRAGGREAVFAFIAITWLCANLAGYARIMTRDEVELSAFQQAFVWAGQPLHMDEPAGHSVAGGGHLVLQPIRLATGVLHRLQLRDGLDSGASGDAPA